MNDDRKMEKRPKGKSAAWLLDQIAFDGPECLIWPFSTDGDGYGQFALDGKFLKAHRWMCEQINGPPPTPKHYAAHECGNGMKGCVHPKHLRWKTSSENAIDRRKHGRPEGAKGTRTRLMPSQIEAIRKAKGTISKRSLAKLLGISPGSIAYWWRSSHEPLPFSTTPYNILRREREIR